MILYEVVSQIGAIRLRLSHVKLKDAGRVMTEKKVLFVATVDAHIMAFHLPYLKWFKEKGWTTYAASNGGSAIPFCDFKAEIDFARSPFSPNNIRAYRELKKLMAENRFDIVHCHTPVGGVLARLAVRKYRKTGTKVLYTAHGFHFYKGAPVINKMIYFAIEKYLSKYTDCLITINNEDYNTATEKLKAKKTVLINGVGYDDDKFYVHNSADRIKYRKLYGYSDDDILLIFVAELNQNKNQKLIIEAMKYILKSYDNVRLLLVGPDNLNGTYQRYAAISGVSDHVDFFGYRNDIDKLIPTCDISLSSSKREGLPVNVMEALACGLPTVVTDIRGNRDLIKDNDNGYIVSLEEIETFADRVMMLIENRELYAKLSMAASVSVKPYSKTCVVPEMEKIYESYGS